MNVKHGKCLFIYSLCKVNGRTSNFSFINKKNTFNILYTLIIKFTNFLGHMDSRKCSSNVNLISYMKYQAK